MASNAVSTLVVLAGGNRRWGSLANRISPVVAFISTADRAATGGGENDPQFSCARVCSVIRQRIVPSSQAHGHQIRDSPKIFRKTIALTPLLSEVRISLPGIIRGSEPSEFEKRRSHIFWTKTWPSASVRKKWGLSETRLITTLAVAFFPEGVSEFF